MTAETIIIAFVFGFLGGMVVGARTWIRLVNALRWHGFDNHLCDRVGCCA